MSRSVSGLIYVDARTLADITDGRGESMVRSIDGRSNTKSIVRATNQLRRKLREAEHGDRQSQ